MYFNIKEISPCSDDVFFVDTNVWFWTTYVASKQFMAKQPQAYQIDHYPMFIESALEIRASLCYSPLTLIELANLIERSEWEIYKAYNKDLLITLKKFRNIPAERKNVIHEIKLAWESVQLMANEIETTLNFDTSNTFIETIGKYKIDGYDVLYYQAMKQNVINKIITDDKDFRPINDIDFYSCYPD